MLVIILTICKGENIMNIKQSEIDNAIYEKYILPTKSKIRRFIGIEIEMPIVNLNKQPVEEKVVFEMTKSFW